MTTVAVPLISWVAEREAIRRKKEAGQPPPWTDDPIFQQYRFCNVRRRDDRVSRWLRLHVLTPANLHLGFQPFIEFTAFCRWNNWPPAIMEVMNRGLYPAAKIDWSAVATVLAGRGAFKQKVWTGAYLIRGDPEGNSKAAFICETVIPGLSPIMSEIKQALQTNSRRAVWEVLGTVSNFGGFMSGQIVDDWGWTPLLWKAKDTYTWAPQGPGSLRGFNRLLGLPLNQSHPDDEWGMQLRAWRKEIIDALGLKFRNLSLMDVQNCLCEADKYLRVKNGEGRPRARYKPETAYQV